MKNFISKTQRIGELGEDVACKFLIRHGFAILERNYTRRWGEIDIVAEKENKTYFVEVKSKSVESIEFMQRLLEKKEINRPEENMHPWKIKRLRRVVETYLISKRLGNKEWQFDLLVVYLDIEKRFARVKVVDNIIL